MGRHFRFNDSKTFLFYFFRINDFWNHDGALHDDAPDAPPVTDPEQAPGTGTCRGRNSSTPDPDSWLQTVPQSAPSGAGLSPYGSPGESPPRDTFSAVPIPDPESA